jgi:hypothetical protein
MTTSSKKKSWLDDFRITDRASCEKAIRNGWIAALISAGVTAIFAMIGMFTTPTDAQLAYVFDPWFLVDVVLILIMAFFVFRKSRIAATVLFIYFVTGKVIMWAQLGEPKGFPLAIVFFIYYLTAMRATYMWHKTYKHMPPAMPEQASA